MSENRTPRPFDALRQPIQQQSRSSLRTISDEVWERQLKAHDDTMEAASQPRTIRQKLRDFFFGLLSAIFFVGFGLLMGMPELRDFLRRVIDQMF